MTLGIWKYVAGLGLVLAFLVGIYAAGNHKGYQRGQQAGNARAAAAEIAQNVAEQDTAKLVLTLQQVNAEADKAQTEAQAAVRRAIEAVTQANDAKAQASKDAAAYVNQLKHATTQPECHGLQEQICTAVPFPY